MIPTGQRGRITGGPIAERFPTAPTCEWFVTVEADAIDTGGFFILYENGSGSQAYDDWVEDRERLGTYLRQIGWEIEWSG